MCDENKFDDFCKNSVWNFHNRPCIFRLYPFILRFNTFCRHSSFHSISFFSAITALQFNSINWENGHKNPSSENLSFVQNLINWNSLKEAAKKAKKLLLDLNIESIFLYVKLVFWTLVTFGSYSGNFSHSLAFEKRKIKIQYRQFFFLQLKRIGSLNQKNLKFRVKCH